MRSPDSDYAPHGLVPDAARFGFDRSSVSGRLGSAVAHSARTSPSRRATIFLHGAAGSWTTWTPLLQEAQEQGITIPNPIVLDLPGWGAATLTTAGRAAVLDTLCLLVKESAESLGFTEWDLVGHSMGGFVALHMATLWPESVVSVGVISPTGWSVIDALDHPFTSFTRLPGFLALWRIMQALAPFGNAALGPVRMLRRLHLLRAATSPLFRHPSRIPASVIDALADEIRPVAFIAASRIARHYNAGSNWSVIECPVHACQGDHDTFSRADDLERMGEVIPDSSRTLLPDCGHFGLIERPAAVLRALGYSHAD